MFINTRKFGRFTQFPCDVKTRDGQTYVRPNPHSERVFFKAVDASNPSESFVILSEGNTVDIQHSNRYGGRYVTKWKCQNGRMVRVHNSHDDTFIS